MNRGLAKENDELQDYLKAVEHDRDRYMALYGYQNAAIYLESKTYPSLKRYINTDYVTEQH